MELFKDSLFVSLLIVAVVLITHILISVLFANKMQEIADEKEYDGSVWGWSFFLNLTSGIVGMLVSALIVIALPTNKNL